MMICIETSTIIFTLSGILCTICACIFPYWKEEKSLSYLPKLSPNYNVGLWTRCHKSIGSSTTQWTCKALADVYSDLPYEVQAMRILILVAIASQTAAFIFSIFGLNCTSIGLQRPDLKYRLNIVSLIFHLISLISISIGTILFTVALMKNSDQSDQYQYGDIRLVHSLVTGSGEEKASFCLYLIGSVIAVSIINIVLVSFITIEASKPNQRNCGFI